VPAIFYQVGKARNLIRDINHSKLAGGPRFPIETPHGHGRVERSLEGRDQRLKFLKGQTGQIQELCGAELHIGEPYTASE
jgi:hypothetical protein